MGVTCQLLLNNGGFSLYKAGQTVFGTVKYFIDKPTEFVSATVSLIGSGKCKWEDLTLYYIREYVGTEEYLAHHIHILQTKKNEIVTVQPGSYEFPFQFIIPEDIPSSHEDTTGKITYKVEVKFTKSGFIESFQKFSTKIGVYSDAKACIAEPLTAGFRKEFLLTSKNNFVYIKGEIGKTFINAGEDIMLTVSIHKETDIPITGIRIELVNLMTYTTNRKKKLHVPVSVNGSVKEYKGISERSETTFRYIIPTFPNLFTIQNSRIINKEYKATVTVKFPFPHINASLELPVIINMVNNETYQEEQNGHLPLYVRVMDEDNKREKDDQDFEPKPHSSKSAK